MRRSIVSSLSLAPQTWKRLEELRKREGRGRSEVVREAVETYYTMKQWRELQGRGRKLAKKLGIKEEGDVARLVHEYRSSRK